MPLSKPLKSSLKTDEALQEMGRTVGKVTRAVLISLYLDPSRFATPKSYQKALGVNLTEKSSGPNQWPAKAEQTWLSDSAKVFIFSDARFAGQ